MSSAALGAAGGIAPEGKWRRGDLINQICIPLAESFEARPVWFSVQGKMSNRAEYRMSVSSGQKQLLNFQEGQNYIQRNGNTYG